MPHTVAIVLKGYPRLSETFIAQEIHALEQRGLSLFLFSLRHPYDPATHPIHAEIRAPVTYLPEYVADDLPRVLRAWWQMRKRPGYRLAKAVFLRDLRRDFTPNRVRRFAQALVLAHDLPGEITHLYAHFMHTPASVTNYASLISALPWSISAHAKDIWTLPEWEKREKLASADWLVTCTASNAEHLTTLDGGGQKVNLLYHGLDFARFADNPHAPSTRDGSNADTPVRIISVGRAVEKKGYVFLLQALAALPADIHWQLTHIGGGELRGALRSQSCELGIADRIEWRGALPQTEVLAQYRESDLFVLPSQIAVDGDRDGLPNVLMEAQSQRLACLSTAVSGIPELIKHGETGWLVEQRDSTALTAALKTLISDSELRKRLAEAGCLRVRSDFSLTCGIDQLLKKFSTTQVPPR